MIGIASWRGFAAITCYPAGLSSSLIAGLARGRVQAAPLAARPRAAPFLAFLSVPPRRLARRDCGRVRLPPIDAFDAGPI